MSNTSAQFAIYDEKALRKAFQNITRHSYRDPKTGRFAKKPDRVIHLIVSPAAYIQFHQLMGDYLKNEPITIEKGS